MNNTKVIPKNTSATKDEVCKILLTEIKEWLIQCSDYTSDQYLDKIKKYAEIYNLIR